MRIEELINILNKNNKIEIKLEGIIDTKDMLAVLDMIDKENQMYINRRKRNR